MFTSELKTLIEELRENGGGGGAKGLDFAEKDWVKDIESNLSQLKNEFLKFRDDVIKNM